MQSVLLGIETEEKFSCTEIEDWCTETEEGGIEIEEDDWHSSLDKYIVINAKKFGCKLCKPSVSS